MLVVPHSLEYMHRITPTFLSKGHSRDILNKYREGFTTLSDLSKVKIKCFEAPGT